MKRTCLFRSYVAAIVISLLPLIGNAQAGGPNKPNWQNLDLKTDSTFGISTEKAYQQLLQHKKPTRVVVAVIDGGVDINHEDLKGMIWENRKEKPDNKIDDDKNGYVDDAHGWDFIGGPQGDINYENLELTRLLRKLKPRFEHVTSDSGLNTADRADYKLYTTVKADFDQQLADAKKRLAFYTNLEMVLDTMTGKMPKDTPQLDYFKAYVPTTSGQSTVKGILLRYLQSFRDVEKFKSAVLAPGIEHFNEEINYNLNLDYSPRDIVKDNPDNSNEHYYGNNDVTGPDAHHGTHVAGIIAAVRDNNLGIKGIANDVVIMSVRTVPNGDERDKDVANAIRYAAANGAKVINMSFGKAYSWDKKVVDDAVKYAISKDVLIIHAAGNDDKNLDAEGVHNYPNKYYANNSGTASNWIEVGASGPKDDESLKATFSNYGKKSVDVFAPGVSINSTIPGNAYAEYSGTSMASPVVAGLAALIRSYYPKLKAAQVKSIILKSVTPVTHSVMLDGKQVPFTDLCLTGGIVNAYEALKLAASM